MLGLAWWIGSGHIVAAGEARPSAGISKLAQELVGRVVPEVESLRGLSFKERVKVAVLDHAAARRHMIRRLDTFAPAERLRTAQRAAELLGLLPPDMDLRKTIVKVMDEQAGGFYDPERRAYYLLDDIPAGLAPLITAHELTHALEDQHFDLDGRMRAVLDDDDRLFALGAVAEGSATLLMLTYGSRAAPDGSRRLDHLQALAGSDSEQLGRLPPLLQRQLLGPYVLGAQFLMKGTAFDPSQGYPAAAVDQAYLRMPQSSEQVLHPEKYWDGERPDEPRRVDLAGAGGELGRGWQLKDRGVLGELVIALLVGAGTSEEPGASWTNAAATGWGGDRWELWVKPPAAALLLLTVWDSPEDAREFAEALPVRRNFQAEFDADRVAIVAGDVGDKAPRLLARMLLRPTAADRPTSADARALVSPKGTR